MSRRRMMMGRIGVACCFMSLVMVVIVVMNSRVRVVIKMMMTRGEMLVANNMLRSISRGTCRHPASIQTPFLIILDR